MALANSGFKNPRNMGFAVVLILVLIGARMIFSPSSKVTNTSDFKGRVIIIGMDGVNPKVLEPMMAAGKLPNFSKLKETGSYSRMSTSNPPQSPVAWTSLGTGQNPGKTGIFDFIKRDPKTYSPSLATSEVEGGVAKSVVKSKRFWEYASEKGVPCTFIAYPITFPPDKNIKGRMLSGMGTPDILGTEGTFTFYTSEVILNKDTGGKVVHVDNNQTMDLMLTGPFKNANDHAEVPFKVTIDDDGSSVSIQLQKQTFTLKQGEWSDWHDASFPMGFMKSAKGIFKMYLVEASPGFKLYVSPINIDPRAPLIPISSPESYARELADDPAVGLYHTQGMPCDTWAVNEKRLGDKAFLEHIDDIDNEKVKALNLEMKNTPEGILYCYFESTDIVQHMFWRYTDPGNPLAAEDKAGPYKKQIEQHFQKMDGILGKIMSNLKPTDTLIVLSDHGFASFRRAAHVNSWLRQNGYLQLKDPSAKSGEDVESVDWSRTKAYALGFGSVYLNIRGRERDGIVASGSEADALSSEIRTKMKRWVDTKDGKNVIKEVYLGKDIFKGEYSKAAPDLFIGFNDGFRASWQTALGGCPDTLIENNMKKWSGDHLIDPSLVPAILFCNKKLSGSNPAIYDIAPTVLKMVGFSDDELKKLNMDGKPLL